MFRFELTEKQEQQRKQRLQGQALRTVGTIWAEDEAGNRFEKTAMFTDDWTVLSFGGYIEYKFDSLIELIKNPPESKQDATHFVIDMGGRNHKGIPGVQIPIDEFRELIDKAIILRDKRTKE